MDLCATPAVELARLIRARELSVGRTARRRAGQDRRGQPGDQRDRHARRRAGLRRGRRARRAGRPRLLRRAAARPADRGEGPGRDGGHQDDLRLAALRLLRARLRRAARGPAQAGRRGGDREDQHAGVRRRIADLQPGVRAHQEPVRHPAHSRRQQRRGRRGGSGRPDPVRGRFRPGGQRAEPGVFLRSGGPADHAGPGARRPVRPAGRGGPDRPHRAGRRAPAGRDVRDRSRAAPGPARTARGIPRPAARVAAGAPGGLELRPG